VEVRTSTSEGRAVLEVANSGPKIAPEDLERLTEPFVRGSDDRTTANGHHGLGLSIVRAIADAHGAELTLQARPVGGLRVIVSFPSVASASGSCPNTATAGL
jgi:signal transduction histidine kinase